VSLNGDLLAAAKADEWVEAEGEVVRRTRELVFTRGTILYGERTLFTASGVWKIFDSGAAPANVRRR
jgi:acyl-coenzyme A thioesterase PaaI-like protein